MPTDPPTEEGVGMSRPMWFVKMLKIGFPYQTGIARLTN